MYKQLININIKKKNKQIKVNKQKRQINKNGK